MSGKSLGLHKFVDGYRSDLWRKSQLNGQWKKRYFVLDKHRFICYEDASCAKVVTEVQIVNDTVFYDIPGHSDDKKHLFYFTIGSDDVFYLSAESDVIKNDWLEALTDSKHGGFKLINQPALGFDPFYPVVDLRVTYGNETFHANNSNKLKPSVVQEPPSVSLYLGHDHAIYTLVMIDLDSVRADREARCSYLHWAIVNIEGTDVSSGLEVSTSITTALTLALMSQSILLLLFSCL